MSLIDDIKYKYRTFNVFEKIIAINVAMFIVFGLVDHLFQLSLSSLMFIHADPVMLLKRPWTLVTHMFMHASIRHIFFNMLILYFTGRIFLNILPARTGLNVYFLGGFVGALLYIISFNVFPVFIGRPSYALGASAAVIALVVFVGKFIPNHEVRLLLTNFKIKLWHFALAFVLIDLALIRGANSGGHIAHLGGALLGYMYASELRKGNDIGAWFERLIGKITALFKGGGSTKDKGKGRAKMRTVHNSGRSNSRVGQKTIHQKKKEKQARIDAILDKIGKSGYDSLSAEEKDFLFKAGRDDE